MDYCNNSTTYNFCDIEERPNYLSRSKNLSDSLDELTKPKFIRSVNGNLVNF